LLIKYQMPSWIQSWFETSWFDYPVKRNIGLPTGPLRHLNVAILVSAVFYFVIITLVNVVIAGYEVVPLISSNFNSSSKLWYEHFIPKFLALVPPSYTCESSMIKVGDGSHSLFL
jgi:hypothetical protein